MKTQLDSNTTVGTKKECDSQVFANSYFQDI